MLVQVHRETPGVLQVEPRNSYRHCRVRLVGHRVHAEHLAGQHLLERALDSWGNA